MKAACSYVEGETSGKLRSAGNVSLYVGGGVDDGGDDGGDA